MSGALADMDVDCDGAQPATNDGRCASSVDTQGATAFQPTVAGYGIRGVNDLDPFVHPFVVFGNEGSKPGWRTFDPRSVGVRKLSVVAVVCGNQLVRLLSLFAIYALLSRVEVFLTEE